jgi:Glycosyltransferase family 87
VKASTAGVGARILNRAVGGLPQSASVAGARSWWTTVRDGIALTAVPVIGWQVVRAVMAPTAFTDAAAYYLAPAADPYRLSVLSTPGAYLYSPAFLQILAPLRALPEWAFVFAIVLAEACAIFLLTGRNVGWVVFLFLPIWELSVGNINMLLALAIVLGFRYPAAWSVVLLTKVTPGVGLLWFAVRREWRSFAVALAATGVIAAVSFVLAPQQWAAWFGVLRANEAHPVTDAFAAQLPARIALAAVLVIWGARTDRRWTVPIAAALATPGLSPISASIAIGAVPLLVYRPLPRRLGGGRSGQAGSGARSSGLDTGGPMTRHLTEAPAELAAEAPAT